MLYNSPVFQFLQFPELPVPAIPGDQLLVACVLSLQYRKYATSSQQMSCSTKPLRAKLDKMRRVSQKIVIQQLLESFEVFKVPTTHSIRCTPQCGWANEAKAPPSLGLTISSRSLALVRLQDALDDHLLQPQGRVLCPGCHRMDARSTILSIDLPDTLLVEINFRKVHYPENLKLRLPSGTQTYQLESGLITQSLPDTTCYSAFWRASVNHYWYMGLDENVASGYAAKRTAEALPPYATFLVYTASRDRVPAPIETPVAIQTNLGGARKTGGTRGAKTQKAKKIVNGGKPVRRSNRLQGKPAEEI